MAAASALLRLDKTESKNVAQTLELVIGMAGTDVYRADWWVEPSSVPFWLALPLMNGTISETKTSGTLYLTANTSMLGELAHSPH